MQDIDDLSTVEVTPDTPDACSPGDKQRLRIHVPNVSTTLSMGAEAPASAIRPEDGGGPSYSGFGVETEGHIFMDAQGPDSTATIQAKSDVVVQSESGVSVGGQAGLIAASNGGAMLAGGGGVTIIGGGPNGWVSNRDSDGTTPGTSPWISSVSAVSSTISAIGAGIDAFVALWHAGKAIHDAKQGNDPMPWKQGAMATTAYLGGVVGGVASGIGTFGAADGTAQTLGWWGSNAGSKFASHLGGTFIHGTGGVIMTSTVTMGLYSLMGTTIASPFGVLIKGGFADLHAMRDASVQALKGSLTLSANEEINMSANSAIAIGSNTSSVTVGGKALHFGARAGSGGQVGTESVVIDGNVTTLSGKTRACVKSDKFADISGKERAGVASSEGFVYVAAKGSVGISSQDEDVAISSPKKVRLWSGDHTVTVAKDKTVIGKTGKAPAPPAPPSYKKYPPKPKSKKKRIQDKWSKKVEKIDAKNEPLRASYESKLAAHAKKVANMKDAKVGIIIKNSCVEVVCNGHKMTFDSGKLKTPSLVISK